MKAENAAGRRPEEITYLKAQVRLLTAKRFSSSSEKTSHIDQQKLEFVFNEVEATAEPSEPEPELVTVSEHKRKRSNRKNLSLEDLPENVIEYRLPEEEEVCPCGNRRHVIGKEVSKELVVVPAKFYVMSMYSMSMLAAPVRLTRTVGSLRWLQHPSRKVHFPVVLPRLRW